MAKKHDAFYFENFITCTDYACQAANLLVQSFREFDPSRTMDMLKRMREVEHAADEQKHELLHVLGKAFITPIEREDIILLSQNIDDMTDKIEDVLLRVYCNNIQSIRPDAITLSELVVRCCEEVKRMVAGIRRFPAFQKPTRLHRPHQLYGGRIRPTVHLQHAYAAHHLSRSHRDHRLAGSVYLLGKSGRRL